MQKIIRATILGLSSLVLMARPALAQTFTFDPGDVTTDLGTLLSRAMIILFFFAAVLAFIFIVIGGIQWITAGGDKIAAQAARDRITAAVVGLMIVVASFAITLIITSVFGLNIFAEGGIKFDTLPDIFPAAGPTL